MRKKQCTCLGTCRGADGLGPGWVCALEDDEDRPEGEPTQSWAVTVERNGERILTIASNEMAGRDLSDEDCEVIRVAARNLLAFVGDTEQAIGNAVSEARSDEAR